MKKTLAFLFACLTALSLLAGCGTEKGAADAAPAAQEAENAPAAEASAFQTMGDVFSYDSENNGFSDTHFVYVFKKDGITYRAIAELPPEISEAIWEIDFFDEDRDAVIMDLVAPLPIMRLDDLSGMIPAQEELDALVGKNVQELLDDEWSFWYWNMEAMEGGMYHGPFSFLLTFDGTVENPEEFDESQADRLTVSSVTFDGIGDATNVLDELMSDDEQ